ncbi:hypothetical protein [Streptomyces aureocirculatus]|uniref:hypothetical protein n=1 Tax=Streptomyces aureocirculatus TaxID=67275 RepID=UPI000AFE3B47|nr:hypothetical protein [Streptomyces aureocirculatus]
MTQAHVPAPPAGRAARNATRPLPGSPGRLGGPRRLLRAVAIVSCLPYLSLKVAWIAGSHVGIPEGSSLLEHRGLMAAANSLTVLMDGAVIVLALLLTRPWGRRVPARLLGPPMWAAAGLLLPIMAGFPAQLAVRALGGSARSAQDTGREPFLDEWVFGVVYGGFILQGICLGLLFALYARDRWGQVWRGRVRDLPRDPSGGRGARVCAVVAAVLALFPAGLRLLWAAGSSSGLDEARAAERTADFTVLSVLEVGYLTAAAAGALMLAFRWPRALPVKVPLALAAAGSGAVACWGAWLFTTSFASSTGVAERPTPLLLLAYAVQMITGTLVAAIGVRFLKERAAGAHGCPS